jgi:two-component system sensor histidine kinase ChiS
MQPETTKPLILIIDDNPVIVDVIRRILQYADRYTTEIASDGLAGFEAFGRLRPACGLVDLKLPGLDGYEVMRRVRSTPAIASTPLIMVTALVQPAERLAGFRAGADGYLAKPFRAGDLLSIIEHMLQLSPEERLAQRQALMDAEGDGGNGHTT